MQKSDRQLLSAAIHAILILMGVIFLFVAWVVEQEYFKSFFLNIGSSLVVVTLQFYIFEVFQGTASSLKAEQAIQEQKDEQETQSLWSQVRGGENSE